MEQQVALLPQPTFGGQLGPGVALVQKHGMLTGKVKPKFPQVQSNGDAH
jgi:hypothetical protein